MTRERVESLNSSARAWFSLMLASGIVVSMTSEWPTRVYAMVVGVIAAIVWWDYVCQWDEATTQIESNSELQR